MIVDQLTNINHQDSNENLAFTLLRIMPLSFHVPHSYDILGARMLWKPKEARILTNFIDQPM
jgi:hypothetical protein